MMVPPNINAAQLNNDPTGIPDQALQGIQQMEAREAARPNQEVAGAMDIARENQTAMNSAEGMAHNLARSYSYGIQQAAGLHQDPNSGLSAMGRVAQIGATPEQLHELIYGA